MRQIVKAQTFLVHELIAGEWEVRGEEVVKSILASNLTLEDALEILNQYKENETEFIKYYIDYEYKALNLEQWEVDWIKKCAKEDAEERKKLIEERRAMGLDLSEFLDDWYEDEYDQEEFANEEVLDTWTDTEWGDY